MSRVLVTGATGFVASHLIDYLLARGEEVIGLRRSWRSPMENLQHIPEGAVHFVDADLTDANATRWAVEQAGRLDYVFHLAAQSYVPHSVGSAHETLNVNVLGTLNLLHATADAGGGPVVHICSSSEVYGQPSAEEAPIKETQELRPVSPYGASKAAMDRLAYAMCKMGEAEWLFITRAFTHSGPRRGKVFFDSAFCSQIARMEKGAQPPVLKVGNLDSVRTVMDVRDTVRGYWELAQAVNSSPDLSGEVFNIGGEETLKVGDVVERLRGMTDVDFEVEVDHALLRSADVTLQIPDLSKIRRVINWQPTIAYEQTLLDMLSYWREHT